jgi:hypothetical protein
MSPQLAIQLASVVLAVHVAAAAFIIFGLTIVPLGATRGWSWVHDGWWRALHAAAIFTVAFQKVIGKTCFLSVWEENLMAHAGRQTYHVPVIHAWADNLIHWNLPSWLLVALYIAALGFTLYLWWRFPPRLAPARRLELRNCWPGNARAIR